MKEENVEEHSGLAVQKAIDRISASGGGRVTISSGVTVCGTIFLKSNVELHLEQGAVLKASPNLEDYHPEDAYPENFGCASEEWRGLHFLIAYRAENVSVTGPGTIDGSGDAFFEERIPDPGFGYCWRYGIAWSKDKKNLRPGQLICFIRCRNVRVTDLSLRNTPCWGIFCHGSENIFIRGVHIFNPKYFVNTDGIDLDCSCNALVSDCIIDTGDDAIAIRADSGHLGENAKICENIRVKNCLLSSASSVFRIGVGDGTIRNVDIGDITMTAGNVGFQIQSQFGRARPGGVEISGVRIHDISMKNVAHPLIISDGPHEAEHGKISDIVFSSLFAESYQTPQIASSKENAVTGIRITESLFRIVPPPDSPEVSLPGQDSVFMRFSGKGNAFLRNVTCESKTPIPVHGFSVADGFDCRISPDCLIP